MFIAARAEDGPPRESARKYQFAVQEFQNLVMQRDELYHEDLQNEPIFEAEIEENEDTSVEPETNPFSTAAQSAAQ